MMCDKRKKRKAGATLFSMDKITPGMLFKQAVIEYSLKHGVTSAAVRYKNSRQKKYDGTVRPLADRSHPAITAIPNSIQRKRSH